MVPDLETPSTPVDHTHHHWGTADTEGDANKGRPASFQLPAPWHMKSWEISTTVWSEDLRTAAREILG